ncbi:MAG: hypothetical protein AAF198_07180 [Pseudomonadota bacterium]
MKHIAPLFLAAVLAIPAQAQDEIPPPSIWDLFTEMEQLAEDALPMMRGWMDRLAPQLEALGSSIGDLSQYEAPEVLPNGDIIIRKKLGPPSEGQTDL